VFHCVPSNSVTTWSEYKTHVPQAPIKPGHVATVDMDVNWLKQQLDQIKGHVVSMPLNFLEKGARSPFFRL
jgi:phospholipase D1/2